MLRLRILLICVIGSFISGCSADFTPLQDKFNPLRDKPVAEGGNGIVVAQVCTPELSGPPFLHISTIELAPQWGYYGGDRAKRYSTVLNQPVYENHALYLKSAISIIKAFIVTLGMNDFIYQSPASIPRQGWTAWIAPVSEEKRDMPEEQKFRYRRAHGLAVFPQQPYSVYPLIRYRWAIPTDQMPGQTFPPSPDDPTPIPPCQLNGR